MSPVATYAKHGPNANASMVELRLPTRHAAIKQSPVEHIIRLLPGFPLASTHIIVNDSSPDRWPKPVKQISHPDGN
jgi:hypothetical protein